MRRACCPRRYLAYAEPAFLSFGSTFATVALLAAYERGGPWLDAAKALVAANARALAATLRRDAPQLVALPLEATYLVWLDCSALGVRGASLAAAMLRAGLVLSPGSDFCADGCADTFMRLNAACPRATIDEAARRLCRAAAALCGPAGPASPVKTLAKCRLGEGAMISPADGRARDAGAATGPRILSRSISALT